MKALLRPMVVLMLVTVAVVGIGRSPVFGQSPAAEGALQYLALGDSLAVGVGASDPATTAYVPRFHDYLSSSDALSGLGLINLSVSGETSSSMISEGQLEAALATLRQHNANASSDDDIRVVTLTIGGNDVFALVPTCSGGLSPECAAAVGSTFETFSGNFNSILGELRGAGGAAVAIIVMTYPNTLINSGCQLNSLASVGEVVLEGDEGLGLPAGLNDLIRSVAQSNGALVAEVWGRLSPSDLQADCLHAND
ncbi:MAG: SGNH/GDSL hydrolase family protein, partial [Dehalococcoidia bacterium]